MGKLVPLVLHTEGSLKPTAEIGDAVKIIIWIPTVDTWTASLYMIPLYFKQITGRCP